MPAFSTIPLLSYFTNTDTADIAIVRLSVCDAAIKWLAGKGISNVDLLKGREKAGIYIWKPFNLLTEEDQAEFIMRFC